MTLVFLLERKHTPGGFLHYLPAPYERKMFYVYFITQCNSESCMNMNGANLLLRLVL